MIGVLKELEREIEKYREELGDCASGTVPGSLRAERRAMCGIVLRWIEGLKGKAQDEIDKAVNDALTEVEMWVMARQIKEMGACLGARASVQYVLEDVGRVLQRARPKAKKEEGIARVLEMQSSAVVLDSEIEFRINGKVAGRIVNIGKEEKHPEPKFKVGQEVRINRLEPHACGGYSTKVRSVEYRSNAPVPGGGCGWWYSIQGKLGGDGAVFETRVREEMLELVEDRPKPKFEVGQWVQDTSDPNIRFKISRIVWSDRWKWQIWSEDEKWSGEDEVNLIEPPTTQKVTDSWEMGVGEECGPCKRRERQERRSGRCRERAGV